MTKKNKYSMVKVFGLPHLHENTAVKFISTGLILSVGLNVSAPIAFVLTFNKFEGKVFKGEHMQVYKLAVKILAYRINDNHIINEQARLLKMVQEDINMAKIGTFSFVQDVLSVRIDSKFGKI